MHFTLPYSLVACLLAYATTAASFPPKPTGLTVVNSTKFPGVSISYKETKICETTEGVKSYSGYVHLPPSPETNRPYEAHMYFWFFGARQNADTAPLALWFQGGPGVPSVTAALYENGPCMVLEDSESTELNPWSWNDKANMLYIDQPVQVGFSYNHLTNGTIDEATTPFAYTPNNFSHGVPDTNLTYLTGTFATPDSSQAPNTSLAAAPAIYDFLQTWMQEFPAYTAPNNTLSIWGESYAGHYIPTFASYIQTRNAAPPPNAIPLHISVLGLISACIDLPTQIQYYPKFAFNNTYNFHGINESTYDAALAAHPQCLNLTATCRALADELDPDGRGTNEKVNTACASAFAFCFSHLHDGFVGDRNQFDITAAALPLTSPRRWPAGWLNSASVQQALGVPLNFTGMSAVVAQGFGATGDFARGGQKGMLEGLVDAGVRVAVVHGDRDYQCNWMAGEALSLGLETGIQDEFGRAGYAEIKEEGGEAVGLVKQYGGLAFAVVWQAGHEIPYYQPRASYEIFNRVMEGRDVATGEVEACEGYSSVGRADAWVEQEYREETEEPKCYVWDVLETCTKEQTEVLRSGSAVTENFILVGTTDG
ncbi:alpha/beta-hydrolase [Polyplosphaeria fusca]|uniref:Carboxypeptidase n=1 Tax=Polyplosphaeria fusca TaxID=682080 RepID=A0A9P4V0X7_9PLEO|nr:alpha/beta-hydrolase [Polyplosphaeria fusca]